MRKNGKKIRLLGVATLLASQLGVFSSALTVVADETTASTSESALVTNTSSEESSTNHSTSATTTTTDATTRASSDKEETSSSSSDDTEEKTVKIGDIQGESQRSPLEGQKVAIKNAVVTKTDRIFDGYLLAFKWRALRFPLNFPDLNRFLLSIV